jgi:hypothetical protein
MAIDRESFRNSYMQNRESNDLRSSIIEALSSTELSDLDSAEKEKIYRRIFFIIGTQNASDCPKYEEIITEELFPILFSFDPKGVQLNTRMVSEKDFLNASSTNTLLMDAWSALGIDNFIIKKD